MNHHNLFLFSLLKLDHFGNSLSGLAVILGSVTQLTANMVSAFFTVAVATTAIIYNIVKTRIALRKEKDRLEREKQGEATTIDDDED